MSTHRPDEAVRDPGGIPPAIPRLPADFCAQLREAFHREGYHADGVIELLGPAAHAALGRGEPEPAFRACSGAGGLGTLIRLFLLGTAETPRELARALAPAGLDAARAAGLLRDRGERLEAGLELRPHAGDGHSWWVLSDLTRPAGGGGPGGGEPSGGGPDSGGPGGGTEHVGGVGNAALSLVRATARRPVGAVCDLGTGSGVQALYASTRARSVTATDRSPRALALAEATFRLNGVDIELQEGSWFAPLARRRFDQIVCNPPFVTGPAQVRYSYRDSGLDGDELSALLVRQMPAFLTEGGTGHLLASWLHLPGEDWRDRARAWVPASTDAWFVQRDVADPAHYVGTWLADAGVDPASAEGRRQAGAWLDWFAERGVEGVGFGFVTLRRLPADAEPDIVCEDLRHAYDDPLGVEATGWLERIAWLRANPDLLAARFVVPASVRLEVSYSLDEQGWSPAARHLRRWAGPGWAHELDELAAALLGGCHGALPLAELIELLALAHDEPTDQLAQVALPIVATLVRHGMLLPAELTGAETSR